MTTTNGFPTSKPNDGDANPELKKPDLPSAIRDGAGPAVSHTVPKPVEVMSVPETPVNGTTPLGQSPRPELNIPAEVSAALKPIDGAGAAASLDSEVSKGDDATTTHPTPPASLPKDESEQEKVNPPPEEKKEEAPVESKPAPTAAPLPTIKEPETEPAPAPAPTPALSKPEEKAALIIPPPVKKAEETSAPVTEPPVKTAEEKTLAAPAPVPAPTAPLIAEPVTGEKRKLEGDSNGDVAPTPGKKAKVEAPATAANGDAPKKAGRPKKNPVKKALAAVVGRTQRKTRSQGPADGAL